jgi:cobalt/nickel transport system permease protein
MHIPDGYLPAAVCVVGYVATVAITAVTVRKLTKDEEKREMIPKISLGVAAFFVASLLSIPVPPTSVHLALTGFMGIFLGIYSYPAIFIALAFQAVLFGHGGITTIGVNAFVFGVPAVICHYIYVAMAKGFIKDKNSRFREFVSGLITGGVGTVISFLIFAAIIFAFMPTTIDRTAETAAMGVMALANIPLLIIEGVLTGFIVVFLKKVSPRMIEVK